MFLQFLAMLSLSEKCLKAGPGFLISSQLIDNDKKDLSILPLKNEVERIQNILL